MFESYRPEVRIVGDFRASAESIFPASASSDILKRNECNAFSNKWERNRRQRYLLKQYNYFLLTFSISLCEHSFLIVVDRQIEVFGFA